MKIKIMKLSLPITRSTAIWKGVRLKDILDKAHLMPGAKYIVFRCFDGYDVGS
jgi:DMSO/TMAO reductase YedYZ molybdopterin-dependent catalytic subunit